MQKHRSCNLTIVLTVDRSELDEIKKMLSPIIFKNWEIELIKAKYWEFKLKTVTLAKALEYYENLCPICKEDKPYYLPFALFFVIF